MTGFGVARLCFALLGVLYVFYSSFRWGRGDANLYMKCCAVVGMLSTAWMVVERIVSTW